MIIQSPVILLAIGCALMMGGSAWLARAYTLDEVQKRTQ